MVDVVPDRDRKDPVIDERTYCVLKQPLLGCEIELHRARLDADGHLPPRFPRSRARTRPPDRRGLQLVVGGAALDHLEAAAPDTPASLALARPSLREPPLAKRFPGRDRRLGALHRRARAGAALARAGRLGRRARAARRARPARGRHAPSTSRVVRGRARGSRARVSLGLARRGSSGSAAGSWTAVAAWFLVSFVVVGLAIGPLAPLLAPGAGFGLAAGVTYAAADVGTKEAVHGGALVLFAAPVWACHVLAFVLIQFSFQRGRALATAGLSSFMTNALPIAAGLAIFHETTPPGVLGGLRFVAFGCVVSGPPRWRAASRPARTSAEERCRRPPSAVRSGDAKRPHQNFTVAPAARADRIAALSVRASTPAARVRRTAPAVRDGHFRVAAAAAMLVAVVVAVGLALLGLARHARGRHEDRRRRRRRARRRGRAHDARAEEREARARPVTFVAGTHQFRIRPDELSVTPDWAQAVEQAQGEGTGMDVIRGFRRLELRLFPAEITPKVEAYQAAVNYEISVIAGKVDRPYKPARLVRHGLNDRDRPRPGRRGARPERGREDRRRRPRGPRTLGPGRAPDRRPAAGGDRARPRTARVRLPSARSRRPSRWSPASGRSSSSPTQLARMLQLPTAKGGAPILGGAAADAYFAKLDRLVGRPARGAHFAAYGSRVVVVPAVTGLGLDVPRSAAALLAAAESTGNRVAHLTIAPRSVGRTTAEANAMGITGLVSSYETIYGGIANRIHNVELVAHLVDNKLIAPGATFSFNQATGARTAAKGFLEAPGDHQRRAPDGPRRRRLPGLDDGLQRRLRGGASDHGADESRALHLALPARARRHRRLPGHRPQVRERHEPLAAAPYLRRLILARRLAVRDAAASTRRHEHRAAEVRRPPPVAEDARSLARAGNERGSGPRRDRVFDLGRSDSSTRPDGKLMSDNTWYSSYRSSPEILLVGPTPKAPPKPKSKPKTPPASTTTTTTPASPAQAARNLQ